MCLMANPTPLLSQVHTLDHESDDSASVSEPDSALPLLPPKSLDSTIELCIGEFGWAQFFQSTLVSFAWAFDAQQTFISAFTDSYPSWHCSDASTCTADICRLPTTSWAWDLPADTSVISEWSLQCAGSLVKGLPASSFLLGCLAGGFLLATLADSSLGRKNMLFLSCLLMSVSSLLTAFFSSGVWVYSAFRFIAGFGRATIGTCALVLSTELVGRRWRGQVGVIGFFCFTIGFLSLPGLAYLNRGSSWRNLYVWTSVPAIFYSVMVRLFVCESPRWLFVRGRKQEALDTLKSIAPRRDKNSQNGVVFPGSCLLETLEEQETKTDVNMDLYSAIKILVRKKWASGRLTAVMLVGFGVGMMYYGMPLGAGNMGFNPYLSVTLNALSELPSSLIVFFLVNKLNRRSSFTAFTLISGVCSVMCALETTRTIEIVLEMVSFSCCCTAFNLLLIYTLELFPTCVRNSAMSIVRQAIVLGGSFSPVLVAAGAEKGRRYMSYGVFGVVIAVCGLFVVFLPETRGGKLCDTMEEEEAKAIRSAVTLSGPL